MIGKDRKGLDKIERNIYGLVEFDIFVITSNNV